MSQTTPPTASSITHISPLATARETIRGFGNHYDYDVTYLEEFMDASPGAFQAFEPVMPMGRYRKAAPVEMIFVAKIAASRVEDCGPCLLLGVKMAREAGVPETTLQQALHGGKDLSPELKEVHDYARAVAVNSERVKELLPRIEERWGREVVAELALAIAATAIYPTLKRALGHAQSCALIPELNA